MRSILLLFSLLLACSISALRSQPLTRPVKGTALEKETHLPLARPVIADTPR
jgi:hypothetical protein